MDENKQELITISQKISDHLWGHKTIEDISAYICPDMSITSQVGEKKGFDDLLSIVKYWREAFPNLKVDEGEWEVNADTVVWEWTAAGTQDGEFMGVDPTGKPVNYEGKTTYVYDRDNRLKDYASEVDIEGILRQLT